MWLLKAYFLPSVSYADRSQLPKPPGIYFVVRHGEIVYIGKAGMGLRARWSDHHQRGLKATDRILYAKVPRYRCGHEEAKAINEFIKKYGQRPRYNDRRETPVFWIQMMDDTLAIGFVFLMILVWFNPHWVRPAIAKLCPTIKSACEERVYYKPPSNLQEIETPDPYDQPPMEI